MSDEIIKVLDALCDKFGIAIDWTQQNLQPYLEDLYQRAVIYKMSTSIAWLIFGVIILIGGIICLKYTIDITTEKRLEYSSEDTRFIMQAIGYFVSGTAIITSIIMIPSMISDIFTYGYLPERAIIELFQLTQ